MQGLVLNPPTPRALEPSLLLDKADQGIWCLSRIKHLLTTLATHCVFLIELMIMKGTDFLAVFYLQTSPGPSNSTHFTMDVRI